MHIETKPSISGNVPSFVMSRERFKKPGGNKTNPTTRERK
jgi:hypothetical protein